MWKRIWYFRKHQENPLVSRLWTLQLTFTKIHILRISEGGRGGVKGTPGPSLASFLYSSLCLSFAFEGNYSQILLIDNSFHSVMRWNAFQLGNEKHNIETFKHLSLRVEKKKQNKKTSACNPQTHRQMDRAYQPTKRTPCKAML